MEEQKKIKILWYSDTPVCSTGFGVVAKNILKGLVETGKYDIKVMGINHWDAWYDQQEYPYKIYIAGLNPERDNLGREAFKRLIANEDFDILFTLNDFNVINHFVPVIKKIRQKKRFKWIAYCPLDADFVVREMVSHFLEADYPVAYNEWSKKLIIDKVPELDGKIRQIYHGCETNEFYPLSDAEKKQWRKTFFPKLPENDFLLINVNRNQWRKDLSRTMYAYKLFHKKHPDSMLYLHSKVNDTGGNLVEQSANIGLDYRKDIIFTENQFASGKGVTIETLNRLYNCADAVVSTTLGEGHGLSCTEAFCVQVPAIFPRNTSLMELIGDNEERGYLADCGTTNSEWTMAYGDSNFKRPLTNVDSFVEKLEGAYNNRQDTSKIDKAYEWAKAHDWGTIRNQWNELFDKAFKDLCTLKSIKKVGRNDICPFCNSGLKYKKCECSKNN